MRWGIEMDTTILIPIQIYQDEKEFYFSIPQKETLNDQQLYASVSETIMAAKRVLEKEVYQDVLNGVFHEKQEPIHYVSGSLDFMTCVVEIEVEELLEKFGSQPVKKMVSIPAWMNFMAKRKGLSLSKIVQDALKEKIER